MGVDDRPARPFTKKGFAEDNDGIQPPRDVQVAIIGNMGFATDGKTLWIRILTAR